MFRVTTVRGLHPVSGVNQGYLFTPGQPQPQDLPKLFKVRLELGLNKPQWQVTHINHSWGQTDPLRKSRAKLKTPSFEEYKVCSPQTNNVWHIDILTIKHVGKHSKPPG